VAAALAALALALFAAPALADGIAVSASSNPAVAGLPLTLTARGTLPIDCTDDGFSANCGVSFYIAPASSGDCTDATPGNGEYVPVVGPAGSPFTATDAPASFNRGGAADAVGTDIVCVWLEVVPPGSVDSQTAATGWLTLPVRAPRYSLKLSVPRHAPAGRRATVTATARAEARGFIALQILPRGYRSCRAAGGPLPAPLLNLAFGPDVNDDGSAVLAPGTTTKRFHVKRLAPRTYIFCGWITPLVGRDILVQRKLAVGARRSRR